MARLQLCRPRCNETAVTCVNERYGLWLLKNSCFAKMAEIWDIENVYQNGDRRSWGFLSQSFFGDFRVSEFFNSHT
jgi:hypothetical protein